MSYATIRTLDGDSYTLSEEDVLWAARMVHRESGYTETAAVLWTTTQRWMQQRKRGTSMRTFTASIRGFSQPINPAWYRDGLWCRVGTGRHWTSGAHERERIGCPCDEQSLSVRDRLQTMPASGIDERKKGILAAWAHGELPNPVPRATNFAATSVFPTGDTTKGQYTVLRAGNHYVTEYGSREWPAGYVYMGSSVGGARAPGSGWVGPAVLAGGIALGAWLILRRK